MEDTELRRSTGAIRAATASVGIVVLPEPDGPTTSAISPGQLSAETLRRTCVRPVSVGEEWLTFRKGRMLLRDVHHRVQ
jgi:hypothetical protein